MVRVVKPELSITEENGDKEETKRNTQNDGSALINSFCDKVPLEFCVFSILHKSTDWFL